MSGLVLFKKKSHNQTILEEILLLGFQNLSSYRTVLFTSFILIYVMILWGNFLIILAINSINKRLHSPMYFFIGNLSVSEIVLTTTIMPKMIQILFTNGATVSLSGCFIQFYFLANALTSENLLLTVMSYDRYLAICRPLHYSSVMHFWFCFFLILACWTTSLCIASFMLSFVLRLHFCGQRKTIDHFFCDYFPILGLSCSEISIAKMAVYLVSPVSAIGPFLLVVLTYVSIIRSVLKIQSVTGKKKAFSTCSSHLSVVCTYYLTLYMVYLVPSSGHSSQVNKVLSLLYTVMTPLLNPLIYSLNNREIRAALNLNFKAFLVCNK